MINKDETSQIVSVTSVFFTGSLTNTNYLVTKKLVSQ